MKKIIYPILFLFILTAGCKDEFFDINTNPNSPTEESITPQLILPRVLHATAARMATSYDYAAQWTGYWTRSGTYGPSNPQENYSITTSYQSGQWSGWYDILADVDLLERKATSSNQKFYQGAAKVLKSIGFMYLVDQYNNVPYSEAFDLNNHILPAYDKGEDVYDSLMVELDLAVELFKAADVDKNPGINEADIVFGADASMWIKLANTQHLKLLIRQSQLAGFNPSAKVASLASNGGFLDAGQTAAVNPGYVVDDGKQNPFWNAYKKTYTGDVADQYNRANNYILDKYTDHDDIRYQYVFSEAASPLNGNIYYGYNFGEVIPNTDPKAANSSDVAGPGLAKSPTQDQWLFTSVESLFLQAEAVQRGWLAGDPQTAYENAVEESFEWLGVTNAGTEADTYLNQADPISNWTLATNKINLIVMQKYFALIGINNFEAYTDYRRLGIPTDLPLSLSPSRGTNVIPKRLLYPQSEYSYNATNVAAEGTIDPQTSTVFWDK